MVQKWWRHYKWNCGVVVKKCERLRGWTCFFHSDRKKTQRQSGATCFRAESKKSNVLACLSVKSTSRTSRSLVQSQSQTSAICKSLSMKQWAKTHNDFVLFCCCHYWIHNRAQTRRQLWMNSETMKATAEHMAAETLYAPIKRERQSAWSSWLCWHLVHTWVCQYLEGKLMTLGFVLFGKKHQYTTAWNPKINGVRMVFVLWIISKT